MNAAAARRASLKVQGARRKVAEREALSRLPHAKDQIWQATQLGATRTELRYPSLAVDVVKAIGVLLAADGYEVDYRYPSLLKVWWR